MVRFVRGVGLALLVYWPAAWSASLAAPHGVSRETEGLGPHPTLWWSPVATAGAYEIETAADPAFTREVTRDEIETTRYVRAQSQRVGDFFWRVRALNPAGNAGAWSETARHRVLAPQRRFAVPAAASLAGIREIFREAAAGTPALVEFAPNATYRIAPSDYGFQFHAVQDLIIDGHGATFLITEPSAGLMQFEDCARITVQNLRVDYDPLPHSVGLIERVEAIESAPAIHLRPEPGYPDFDAPHMMANWSWGVVLDSDPARRGWMKPGSPLVANFGPKVTRERVARGGHTFRIPLPGLVQASYYQPGDRVIVFARKNGRELFGHQACDDVTYSGITIHACPAGHFNFQNGSNAKVLNCREEPGPGRWFAGNADGVHMRGNATGVWVEGCVFDSIGDDAVALYNKGMAVTRLVGRDCVEVETRYFDLRLGGRFRIFNPRDGVLVGAEYEVLKIAEAGPNRLVTFAPDLPPEARLVAVPDVPTESDQLFNCSLRNDDFVVRRNRFRAIRRYGTVFRSGGIVTDNDYIGISGAAIALLNEPRQWRNGLGGENILIARNRVTTAAFDASSGGVGQIEIVLRTLGGVSRERLYREVTITGNQFCDWKSPGIGWHNIQVGVVHNNTFDQPRSAPGTSEPPVVIMVTNASDCIIRENRYPWDSAAVGPAIRIEASREVIQVDNGPAPVTR